MACNVLKILKVSLERNSIITFHGYTDDRMPPRNFVDSDWWLFQNAQRAVIPNTRMKRVNNAHILNDTIFCPLALKVYSSFSRIHPPRFKPLLHNLILLRKKPVIIDKGIWITDEWSCNYFHFMTDSITRLIGSLVKPNEYEVLLPKKFKSLNYVSESLDLFGFKPFYYEPGVNVKVKELVLPTHTAISGDYNNRIISIIRKKLFGKYKPNPFRKIYITRKNAKSRFVVNEAEILIVLQSQGYEIHSFETYTWIKQLKIMTETKCLIGLHGAGLTNMLFMSEGANVLEFRRKADDEFNCYYNLANTLKHSYFYQVSETIGENVKINIENLKQILTKFETT